MPPISVPGAPSAARGRLAAAAAALLWSMGGVFIKSIALPPAWIAMLRSLFAGLALLPFVRRRPGRPGFVALSILSYTGVVGLFVLSTKITTAANAIILQYTAPLFVFLIELARGRRPDRLTLLTLLGGMGGIAVIYLGSEPGDLPGIATALVSGLFFAAWMVIASTAPDADPLALTTANNLGAALVLLPFALLGPGPRALASPASSLAGPGPLAPLHARPSLPALLALLAMGVLQLGLPYVLFTRGLKSISAQEASLLALVEPVANPVWVAIGVGEVPSRATIAGGAVIVLTLALRYLRPAGRPS